MSSKINASNSGGGGIIQTADASGVLELQGGGNTGISISAAGVPTITAPTVTGVMTGIGSNSVLAVQAAALSMPTANSWYNGPNTGSIGGAGQKWLIVASGAIQCAASQVYGEISIWDGSAYVAAQGSVGANTNWPALGTAAYYVTMSGAMTFTLRAAANVNNSTLLGPTTYSIPGSTYIYALRLA